MSQMHIKSNTPLQSIPDDYCPKDSQQWFKIQTGYDTGKLLFYSDHTTGKKEAKNTILFIHGNPESSYTFRHIRDELIASDASLRLVSMDHIGFGLSDQATFEMIEMHHANNLLQLVQHLDLQNITLVVHDWGGPIGIGALLEEPERVKNLLVMNTTVFPMPNDGLTYQNYPITWFPWSMTPKLIPNFAWGGLAAYVVSHASPQSNFTLLTNILKYLFLHTFSLIDDKKPEYIWSQMLRSTMNAKSSKRNVLQTPYWGHGYTYSDPTHGHQDNHAFYEKIQQTLTKAWGNNIQACGYFGQWDACGKHSVIKQWHHALKQMKNNTQTYSDVGHFIEEYKGAEIAQSILQLNK